MPEPRAVPRHMSAGVILVDAAGRVLMQLRDDNPSIMFPGHWGLTGGAAAPGETPEQTARREVREETGVDLDRFEPFRAYYFSDEPAPNARRKGGKRTDYELYLFHAPCTGPAEDLVCGEGRELRFFTPGELPGLDIAYNHRDVLDDFFASPIYARYLTGAAFEGQEAIDAVAHFTSALDAGAPWFDALMEAIAVWETPAERVDGRAFRYLIGGEAFDWLLLAERLIAAAPGRVPPDEAARLLFSGIPPGQATPLDDARLRDLIGEQKHRAHLNYVYGVIVEEALQYATELEFAKQRSTVSLPDGREADRPADPVYERIYGRTCSELLTEYRTAQGLPAADLLPLGEWREFLYWLFKYRVQNNEPALVASDTRRALVQLSAITDAVQRRRARLAAREYSPA